LFRLYYKGVSNSWQPTIARQEERGTAWKFEAMIDAAHHAELIDERGDIFPDYFRLRILQCILNWENFIEQYDLVCYSA
jgi:hypothetical protein